MARAAKTQVEDDPTYYPETDHMGEGLLQREIADVLRFLIATLFAMRRVRARVGANQFMYYRKHAPTISVAPDVYVLPGVDPELIFGSWKIWERGVAPSFALEIVSDDWQKDYRDGPPRYEELGAQEVVIFDPEPGDHPERIRWQVYRRDRAGRLVLSERSAADRIRSRTLRCWIRVVGEGAALRLRVGVGLRGDELVLTDAERAEKEAERAEKEAERAEKEAERAEKDAERAEKAERELARLRAELASARSATKKKR